MKTTTYTTLQKTLQTTITHALAFCLSMLSQSFWAVLFVSAVIITTVPTNSMGKEQCSPLDQTHDKWDTLLKQYVRGGRVFYSTWLKEGTGALDTYLGSLAGVCDKDYLAYSEEQQLAYWINSYNANTVKLILDNFPITSIKEIGLLPGAAWRESFIKSPQLEKKMLSLNMVEHEILRKRFDEPRIHFALVCASTGCPVLSVDAYKGRILDEQLARQTRKFLADNSKNQFSEKGDKASLSKIFKWFKNDFVKSAGSLEAFLSLYAPVGVAKNIAPGSIAIDHLKYDWTLNGE